jgi:hypothetical protein
VDRLVFPPALFAFRTSSLYTARLFLFIGTTRLSDLLALAALLFIHEPASTASLIGERVHECAVWLDLLLLGGSFSGGGENNGKGKESAFFFFCSRLRVVYEYQFLRFVLSLKIRYLLSLCI